MCVNADRAARRAGGHGMPRPYIPTSAAVDCASACPEPYAEQSIKIFMHSPPLSIFRKL